MKMITPTLVHKTGPIRGIMDSHQHDHLYKKETYVRRRERRREKRKSFPERNSHTIAKRVKVEMKYCEKDRRVENR
jgi:hypothetical protein